MKTTSKGTQKENANNDGRALGLQFKVYTCPSHFFFFFNVNLPTCPASDLTELSDDALLPHLYELLLWNATSEGGLERSCTEARAMKFILELLC